MSQQGGAPVAAPQVLRVDNDRRRSEQAAVSRAAAADDAARLLEEEVRLGRAFASNLAASYANLGVHLKPFVQKLQQGPMSALGAVFGAFKELGVALVVNGREDEGMGVLQLLFSSVFGEIPMMVPEMLVDGRKSGRMVQALEPVTNAKGEVIDQVPKMVKGALPMRLGSRGEAKVRHVSEPDLAARQAEGGGVTQPFSPEQMAEIERQAGVMRGAGVAPAAAVPSAPAYSPGGSSQGASLGHA